MENNKVVYIHRRNDTNKVFYVGMGSKKRAYSKSGRNNYWKNTVNKVGYNIEIVDEEISKKDALELEIFMIAEYGLYNLCNITEGGEHHPIDLATRIKISNTLKGVKHSEQRKINIGLGSVGHKMHQNTREALKNANVNRKHSKESKIKMSISKKGTIVSDKTKDLLRNINLGKKYSEESKLKRSLNNPKNIKIIDINTNIIYRNLRVACEDINLNKNTIKAQLSGRKNIQLYNSLRYYER
jgi:hypothetical protein